MRRIKDIILYYNQDAGLNDTNDDFNQDDLEWCMKEYAKEVIKACHELSQTKFMAGESGYISKEDVQILISNLK